MFKRLFLKTLGKVIPSDVFSHRFPVSVKGICFIDKKVILLKNERDEWDLPGGKLNKGEQIEDCLIREIKEELSIPVRPQDLLDVITLDIMKRIEVIIVIYSCLTLATIDDIKISEENFDIGSFTILEIDEIALPQTYKEAIIKAYNTQYA